MPKSPRASKKQITQDKNKDAAALSAVPPTVSYEETQLEEIEVLRSIYGDDYHDVETKKAWSKAFERSFKIRLTSNLSDEVSIVLNVTLTSTYPRSIPLLRITDVTNVRQNTLSRLEHILSARPKALVSGGEVMIYQIASELQETLDDEVSARARDEQLPSLEEERAVREAASVEAAKLEEEQRLRLESEARRHEEEETQRRLEQEVKKREEARRKRQSETAQSNTIDDNGAQLEQVTFDQPVVFVDEARNRHTFRSIYLSRMLAESARGSLFTAMPSMSGPQTSCFVLKRYRIPETFSKVLVLELERILERLKIAHHDNVINVLSFKLSIDDERWQCDVLTEFAARGSLSEMLDMIGEIPPQKARTYIIDLLQALDFYHKHGIVHGRIHSGNVLFTHLQSGLVTIKLADAGFGHFLHDKLSEQESKVTPAKRTSSKQNAWIAPELASHGAEKTRRTDIWDFGIVVIEMLTGLESTKTYISPSAFIAEAGLSTALGDLLKDMFAHDSRRRANAFDLIPYEFLRTDCSTYGMNESSQRARTTSHGRVQVQAGRRLQRSESSTAPTTTATRWTAEWDEIAKLGKGGYGEVVKARNKLDGRIYAVKKIVQKSLGELHQVLSEVYLLATLNHPYVVRYYTCWPEEDEEAAIDGSSFADSGTPGAGIVFESDSDNDNDELEHDPLARSTGGLDFISSSGYPRIEFGDDNDDNDSDDDDSDESDDNETEEANGLSTGSDSVLRAAGRVAGLSFSSTSKSQRAKSFSRPAPRSVLYLQMEYCERLTLRDMIRKGIYNNNEDVWRLFRQILEGLCHVHTHGIIHRDLKPENIFIDAANNPKIGDFGLATSGSRIIDAQQDEAVLDDDMTRNVGTTLYVAPELRTHNGGNYTDKIDMYSLGIILFEMCFALPTAMERIQTLNAIRQKEHKLPNVFHDAEKALQGEIIEALITHRPSERPSSTQLLQSGKIPVQIEDETIRLALEGLGDDNSPYHHKIVSALFASSTNTAIKAQLWDQGKAGAAQAPSTTYLLLQAQVRDVLTSCFRRHGAVEVSRRGIIPLSSHYNQTSVVKLLDASGTLVQLAHDGTLPHARNIARQEAAAEKAFSFQTVYRNGQIGSAPRSNREADFDIASNTTKDLALQEAEVVKTMDEVIDSFPSLRRTQMCFHISHGRLLDIILDFCRIPNPQHAAVKEVLTRLNIKQDTWTKIRLELRSSTIGVSSTSLDELARFDFRERAETCLTRLQSIFTGSQYMSEVQTIFTQLVRMHEYCQRLGVKRKIFFSPLSNFNEKFYKGGIMFQCLFDKKTRDVLAAGGRYDALVAEYRPRITGGTPPETAHAVGINIGFDIIVHSMARHLKDTGGSAYLKKGEEIDTDGDWAGRRCDVLIAAFDPAVLRSTGLNILSKLWNNDISAELAVDVRSPEELNTHYRDDKHSWIITIKHEDIASDKPDLKVVSVDKKSSFDVRSSDIVNVLRAEIRDRDQRTGGTTDRSKLLQRQSSQPTSDMFNASSASDRRTDVQVLLASHKSKKGNKWRVVEQAQHKAQDLLRSYADGPIACVETRDEVVEMIRETRLSDAESWRRVVQEVSLNERQYMQEVWDMLKDFKTQYADAATGQGRNCFVFNFRTGLMILYDLLL